MKEYRKVRKTYQGKIWVWGKLLIFGKILSWVTKRGAFEPKIEINL